MVAYGGQNTFLSGNPDFTYFYKIYKKYSHFSQENVTIPLEGPNELSFTNPIQLRVKIQRIGDLLSDMYLTFRIPDIYCKDVSTPDNLYAPGTERTDGSYQFDFQWVRFLGAHIIRNAAFFVGGQKIQEFDSEYIIAKAFSDLDKDAFAKWQRLIGDVPELNNPSDGLYKGYNTNGSSGYPYVVSDGEYAGKQQNNNPSIPGRDIMVPIPFWFCQSFANSLPLIALQYHDCEVQFTLRPIQELYTILDQNGGYRVAPGNKLSVEQSSLNQPVYLPAVNSSGNVDGNFNLFAVDFGFTPPVINSWFLNPRIQCTFIYLTDDERKVFANQPLSYLLYQTTLYSFPGLFNRQVLDIDTHNPINRLLLVPRRSDTLPYRNDVANYTNWWFYPLRFLKYGTNISSDITSSGVFYVGSQDAIIRHLRVLMDGNEIQEEKPVDYFTKVVTWRNERGGSALPQTNYLPVYSFELESTGLQPSGSVNTSKVRLVQIEVDPWPLPQPILYLYDLNIYVENINWFEVAGGMGGLKWAL